MTLKIGKNQTLRPSGVVASKDGKYFYWSCSVSGIATFANAERFKNIVARYGDEKRLVKEFVSRPAQKYLDQGHKPEDIRKLVEANNGDLPKLWSAKNDPRAKELKKAAKVKKVKKVKLEIGTVKESIINASGSVEVIEKKVYPWSADPENYFKSTADGMVDYGADTATCHRPQRFLDDLCHGCPLYDVCGYSDKYGPNDYLDVKKTRKQPMVKRLNSFEDEVKPN